MNITVSFFGILPKSLLTSSVILTSITSIDLEHQKQIVVGNLTPQVLKTNVSNFKYLQGCYFLPAS